ncbi:MAG TPA: DUF1223 domain-containing protein [Kofleriaceae bacterium]|nr:DUF1223 domain-containing protein [Kofleriaceae bacterium]
MKWLPLVALLGCATAAGDTRPDDGPVVIELFTSQGCSSCPPADALLSKLAREGALGGRKLAPLSFHVDYWNDLGWADPFSTGAWTARQQAYARALGDGSVYTPELVVAGGAGVVGSQGGRVAQAIADAPRQLAVTASASWQPRQVTVSATAPADADVWVAIWEDGTHTKVARGENAGETLVGDRVVRRLERVATAGRAGQVAIALDGGWQPGGAVAFAQRADRKIVGATLLAK